MRAKGSLFMDVGSDRKTFSSVKVELTHWKCKWTRLKFFYRGEKSFHFEKTFSSLVHNLSCSTCLSRREITCLKVNKISTGFRMCDGARVFPCFSSSAVERRVEKINLFRMKLKIFLREFSTHNMTKRVKFTRHHSSLIFCSSRSTLLPLPARESVVYQKNATAEIYCKIRFIVVEIL